MRRSRSEQMESTHRTGATRSCGAGWTPLTRGPTHTYTHIVPRPASEPSALEQISCDCRRCLSACCRCPALSTDQELSKPGTPLGSVTPHMLRYTKLSVTDRLLGSTSGPFACMELMYLHTHNREKRSTPEVVSQEPSCLASGYAHSCWSDSSNPR
jgi:hypothetical protein